MARGRPVSEVEWIAGVCRRMVTHARRFATDRQVRLLLCGFCRRYADQLPDDESRTAVTLAEGYADGVVPYRRLIPPRVHVESAAWGDGPEFGERSDLAACLYQALQPRLGLAVCDLPQLRNHAAQVALLRDAFGNPFRPVAFAPRWRTETAVALASGLYADHAFDRMPILADALEEAGCDRPDVLSHCRDPLGVHARGCWVVDLVLGKG
jgi:hypothetical protein